VGEFYLVDDDNYIINSWRSLELPDKGNQKRISRIPEGDYVAKLHVSPRFGECLWIQDVPNRSEILVHRGNFHYDILGCVLIGKDLKDINGDGYLDVTSSATAMKELLEYLEGLNSIEIEIYDEI